MLSSAHLAIYSETIIVTNPNDNGLGTLGQALLDAQPGDTITFDSTIFPPTSPMTITLQSELPEIITDSLTIDGSHAGVVLDGQQLNGAADGLTVNGAYRVTIQGLQIINFPGNGIELIGGAEGAVIGGNRGVGTAPLGQGNLLSNNSRAGIGLSGVDTANNQIVGNYIGTDLTGKVALGNYDGVMIREGAHDNIIGGATAETRNLISGNDTGVFLDDRYGQGTSGNRVSGNHIGTDATCTSALGNGEGIRVAGGTENTIGGEGLAARNVISGNAKDGVLIINNGAMNNQVLGNYIGTDCNGTGAIGNDNGVRLNLGAANNVIGGTSTENRNIISGNNEYGVFISLRDTTRNKIIGNYIGTDVTGRVSLGNAEAGVQISSASQNTVGGTTPQERNIISGNGDHGVMIQGSGSTGNRIIGNYIGTDATGLSALANDEGGVVIAIGARRNFVGGETEGAGNIISGNNSYGINIRDNGATGNQVRGNYIGTDATGTRPLQNMGAGVEIGAGASNNLIGGDTPAARNFISGNQSQGILLKGTNNQILGNSIGTDKSGEEPIPNNIGVEINDSRAIGNVISGTLIGFNTSAGVIAKRGMSNVFQRNVVQHNGGVAAQLTLGNKLIDNDFFANEFNVAQVSDGTLSEDETWTAQGDLHTYLVVEDDLLIPSGRTLTVAPGVNVQFDFGLQAEIEGALVAEGSADEPIHFTSAQRFANPLPGEWKGLSFAAGSTGLLAHTSIEFAENGLTLLNGATVEVISSTIAASEKHGILVPSETLTFTLTLDHNAIAGNGQLAINNQSAMPISAPDTWWGSASGPNHASNPDGQGDAVSANVNIERWLRDSAAKDAWSTALVANPGSHHFMIDDHRSLHWFRIPMDRGATLTATLSHPHQDYDLFFFSNLQESATLLDDLGGDTKEIGGDTKEIGGDTKEIGDGAEICSSHYIAQVANLGQANLGKLRRASCGVSIGEEEVVSTDVWDQSGWYYLMVAGHNGASDNTISYTLEITLTEGTTGVDLGFEPPLFDPPESSQPGKKSIILTNEARLKERYQPNEVDALMNKLDQLATHPQVAGVVIDLGTYDQLDEVYESWDEHITDTLSANYVAASVKALLTSMRGAYPDLEHILIVGNDEIIPFRRIPDEVTIANERNYSPPSIPPEFCRTQACGGGEAGDDSALMNNLRSGYFLSDDYYADFAPIPYRGRGLFLPEYAMGRLVETPSEMTTAIDTFLQTPVLTVTSGLVTGYDFLTDQANAIVQELEQGGLTPDTLINDSWQANDLKEAWLNTPHDLSSINAHFQHDIAIPAERAGGDVSAAEVQASNNLTSTVVFSVGCHSGLPVAGSEGGQLDFAQVLMGRGAMYVANTGYGYGDANAIGYSEELMRLFVRHLREGATVGQALAQAKSEYFNTMGIHSMTPYDEKVLAVATFYGFPMYQVRMPNASNAEGAQARQRTHREQSAQLGKQMSCPEGLTCRQAIFTPIYATESVTDGTYFTVEGETQEVPGQPIQPRTSLDIFSTTITNTFEIEAARGVLFEGGHYESFPNFDPVITRIITESTDLRGEELPYSVDAWRPAEWERINSLRQSDKITQRLVVMPAQYRATTDRKGVMRRFSDMSYTVYYSTTRDTIPPSIWTVATTRQEESEQVKVEVEVTDFSGVVRTVATYTTGYGRWQSVDLEQIGDSNRWQGHLPDHPTLEYFVQAVDKAGNVAIHDNKGRYFSPPALIYLPIMTR